MAEETKVVKNDDGTITVDGKTFISKDSYDVVADKQREATDKIKKMEDKAKADKEAADKKAAEESGKYKELYEAKEKEIADMKTSMEAEKRTGAIKEAAAKLGAHNAETVVRLIDASKVEIGEDGAVKAESLNSMLNDLKTSQPYLFGEGTKPADNAGAGSGGAGEGGSGGGTPTFYRSQLSDAKFYSENRDAILAAERNGAIVDDVNGGAKRV